MIQDYGRNHFSLKLSFKIPWFGVYSVAIETTKETIKAKPIKLTLPCACGDQRQAFLNHTACELFSVSVSGFFLPVF